MSEVRVNKLSPRSGTTVTLGDSGDTITIPSGVTLSNSGTFTNFQSTGIDDNATSTAITIDSSQQVGIGTASPGRIFEVSADQSYVSIKSTNDSTGTSQIFFGDTADDNVGRINYQHSDNSMLFLTSASERMRIDSSGKVGIGTSSPQYPLEVTGVTLVNGNLVVTGGTDSNDRRFGLTHDGSNVIFKASGNSTNRGFSFHRSGDGSADAVLNISTGGHVTAGFNDAQDLGSTSKVWRDLYLGGGAYLGGTASANHLDDYEEGTWTPTASNGVTGFTIGLARYRKIGSLVYVQAYLTGISGKSASNLIIDGLPFSTETNGFAIGNIEGGSTSGKMGIARPDSAGTKINFYYPDTSTVERTIYTGNDVGNFIILSLTYHVA